MKLVEELDSKKLLTEVAQEDIKTELMTKLRELIKDDIASRLALEVLV